VVRSVRTFSASPCIVTHLRTRTPIAQTFANSVPAGPPRSTHTPVASGITDAREAVLRDRVDHRLLEQADVLDDPQPRPLQIHDRVEHHLPRAVVGDVPAPIGLADLDPVRREHLGRDASRWSAAPGGATP
jgi:hypothetical protein